RGEEGPDDQRDEGGDGATEAPAQEQGPERVHPGDHQQEDQRLLETADLRHVAEEATRVGHDAAPGIEEPRRRARRRWQGLGLSRGVIRRHGGWYSDGGLARP